jgi:hypothetical protein
LTVEENLRHVADVDSGGTAVDGLPKPITKENGMPIRSEPALG